MSDTIIGKPEQLEGVTIHPFETSGCSCLVEANGRNLETSILPDLEANQYVISHHNVEDILDSLPEKKKQQVRNYYAMRAILQGPVSGTQVVHLGKQQGDIGNIFRNISQDIFHLAEWRKQHTQIDDIFFQYEDDEGKIQRFSVALDGNGNFCIDGKDEVLQKIAELQNKKGVYFPYMPSQEALQLAFEQGYDVWGLSNKEGIEKLNNKWSFHELMADTSAVMSRKLADLFPDLVYKGERNGLSDNFGVNLNYEIQTVVNSGQEVQEREVTKEGLVDNIVKKLNAYEEIYNVFRIKDYSSKIVVRMISSGGGYGTIIVEKTTDGKYMINMDGEKIVNGGGAKLSDEELRQSISNGVADGASYIITRGIDLADSPSISCYGNQYTSTTNEQVLHNGACIGVRSQSLEDAIVGTPSNPSVYDGYLRELVSQMVESAEMTDEMLGHLGFDGLIAGEKEIEFYKAVVDRLEHLSIENVCIFLDAKGLSLDMVDPVIMSLAECNARHTTVSGTLAGAISMSREFAGDHRSRKKVTMADIVAYTEGVVDPDGKYIRGSFAILDKVDPQVCELFKSQDESGSQTSPKNLPELLVVLTKLNKEYEEQGIEFQPRLGYNGQGVTSIIVLLKPKEYKDEKEFYQQLKDFNRIVSQLQESYDKSNIEP